MKNAGRIGVNTERRVKSLSSEAIFDPSRHFIGSPAGGKKRAVDGMQPFGWPCGRLGEESRRQVDIWPVCYCEFQILWLSLTLNLLEFFNLGIPERVHSQWLTSLLAHPFLTPLFTDLSLCTHRHTNTRTKLQDSLFRGKKRGRGKKKSVPYRSQGQGQVSF